MSSEKGVSEDVEDIIKKIIAKYNLNPICEINYQPGSEPGDGYISKTVAVDIKSREKSLQLFLKCASNIQTTDIMPIEKAYSNEEYFYNVVYPAYLNFLKTRNVEDGFRNAPKCYGISVKNVIALENLRPKGFILFDRENLMNDSHIALVLKTLAKFHAISFAYKDQEKKSYDKLADNYYNFFNNPKTKEALIDMIVGAINSFIRKLNINLKHEKVILDKCITFRNNLANLFPTATQGPNIILTHGDCWCNNIMFSYEEERNEPCDVMLIDWQIITQTSPVHDISYFFYTVASEDALNKLTYYLNIYHQELSKSIKQLGSDPELLYHFSIFEKEWKQYSQYGFAMAFVLIKVMLSSEDEVLNMEDIDFSNKEQLQNLYPKFEKEDKYIRRMKVLAQHMISHQLL